MPPPITSASGGPPIVALCPVDYEHALRPCPAWVCVPLVLRRVFDSEPVSNTSEKLLAVNTRLGFFLCNSILYTDSKSCRLPAAITVGVPSTQTMNNELRQLLRLRFRQL